jgi:hypothetical protein
VTDDGRQYAAMLQYGRGAGTPMSRMRPVVVILARTRRTKLRPFRPFDRLQASMVRFLAHAHVHHHHGRIGRPAGPRA